MLPRKLRLVYVILFVLCLAVLINPIKSFAGWLTDEENSYRKSISACESEENSTNMPCYINALSTAAIGDIHCKVGGICVEGGDPSEKIFLERSLLNQSGKLIAVLYEYPAANTGVWVADAASNIGLIPKAYAQGIGFSALSPLLNLWKAFRNVAYSFLIIVLLVIGLMIMFRAKIDPRTVISLQSALPRIVITLILITFSYPIAGFLIDLMYVILFLGISVVASTNPDLGKSVAQMQAEFSSGGGLWSLFFQIIPTNQLLVGLGGLGIGILSLVIVPLKAGGLIAAITNAWASTPVKVLGLFGGGMFGLLTLLLLIAFVFAIIRIWFMLLNSYIQIIISVIFAPIFLLGHAIPGRPAFSTWLRNLIANIVVFPTTAILIVVAGTVNNAFKPVDGGADIIWTPPLLGYGRETAEIIISIGFALLIPQLVVSIKKLVGAKPVVPLGGAFGKAVGQPVGVGQQIMGTLGQFKLVFGGGVGRPG